MNLCNNPRCVDECYCFCKCGMSHTQCTCGWKEEDYITIGEMEIPIVNKIVKKIKILRELIDYRKSLLTGDDEKDKIFLKDIIELESLINLLLLYLKIHRL